MKKLTMQLEQLVCPACAQKIETALKNAPGVEGVVVLFNASKARVSFDESKTQPESITTVVKSLGYEVLKVS